MSDQGSQHVHGGLISEDELRQNGVQIDPNVNLPTQDYVVLDDDDAGECRWATRDEIRAVYADNAVTASPVQPDVWTLEIDNEPIWFGYANGSTWEAHLGWFDKSHGPGVGRYRKRDGIAFPIDDGGNLVLNATTMPRLVHLREWAEQQMLERSEERLQMAELVNAFASIIASNSGLDGVK